LIAVCIHDGSLVFVFCGIDANDDFPGKLFSLYLQTLMVHGEPP